MTAGSFFVMPGLAPGIHVFRSATRKTWMAGTSPAMTSSNTKAFPPVRERVLNTADAAEGIKSFVERRAAVFQGR